MSIRTDSTTRDGISPFSLIVVASIVALTVIGVLVAIQ
jgi:hypothetical protein